jgi:hypothetical protein
MLTLCGERPPSWYPNPTDEELEAMGWCTVIEMETAAKAQTREHQRDLSLR